MARLEKTFDPIPFSTSNKIKSWPQQSAKMKGIFRKLGFRERQKKKKESTVDSRGLPSAFEEMLPPDVKRRIASFLPFRDLLKLSEASKRLNEDLGIVTLNSSLADRASQNRFFENYTWQCFGAVIPNQRELHPHSMTFSFDLVTNQFTDGNIWILEQDLPEDESPDSLKGCSPWSGKYVAEIRATESRKVYLSFIPKIGKFYQFWVTNESLDSAVWITNMMLYSVGFETKIPLLIPSFSKFQFDVPPSRTHRFALR